MRIFDIGLFQHPARLPLSSHSISIDPVKVPSNESQVNFYHKKATDSIDIYLLITGSAPPGSYVVGRTGVRVGEYEEMSDNEEVNY